MVLLTCAEQEKQIWAQFTVCDSFSWHQFPTSLLGFLTPFTIAENTTYSRRIQKPVFFSGFKRETSVSDDTANINIQLNPGKHNLWLCGHVIFFIN